MTNALEIRRVSLGHLLKSGCGVPPQTVAGGVSPPVFLPKLTIFRLTRIQGVWESRPHSSSSFQRFSFQHFSFYPNIPPQRKLCPHPRLQVKRGELNWIKIQFTLAIRPENWDQRVSYHLV